MSSVLVRHPAFGSLWLSSARIVGNYVEGEVWDESSVGSPYMPDDFHGEAVLMNFPKGCIVKWSREAADAPE